LQYTSPADVEEAKLQYTKPTGCAIETPVAACGAESEVVVSSEAGVAVDTFGTVSEAVPSGEGDMGHPLPADKEGRGFAANHATGFVSDAILFVSVWAQLVSSMLLRAGDEETIGSTVFAIQDDEIRRGVASFLLAPPSATVD